MATTARVHALHVSTLVSKACALFMTRLFREAFIRFRPLSAAQKKWVFEFALLWCDSLALDALGSSARGGGPTDLTAKTLLSAMFSQFTADATHGDLPLELSALWQRLAQAYVFWLWHTHTHTYVYIDVHLWSASSLTATRTDTADAITRTFCTIC